MARKIKSLKQLPSILIARRQVVLNIEEEEWIITLKRMSYKKWREIEEKTPAAMPFVNFNNQTGRRDYELDHPETAAAFNKRDNLVSLKRLANAIEQDFPSTCKTDDEKAEYLMEIFDESTLSYMFAEMSILHGEVTRSSFQRTEEENKAGKDTAARSDGAVDDDEVGESS